MQRNKETNSPVTKNETKQKEKNKTKQNEKKKKKKEKKQGGFRAVASPAPAPRERRQEALGLKSAVRIPPCVELKLWREEKEDELRVDKV